MYQSLIKIGSVNVEVVASGTAFKTKFIFYFKMNLSGMTIVTMRVIHLPIEYQA